MKDYVLSRAFDPLLFLVDEYDLDEAQLLRGLSFGSEQIRDSWYARIPWNEFAKFCARVQAEVGSEVFDDFDQFMPDLISLYPFLRVGGVVAGPRWYYNLSKKWFGSTMFPAVELEEFEEIASRTLRVVLRIPDELADCPQFFRITAAFDRQGPAMLGMEPASVQLNLEPRRGVYTIHYPPSASLVARVRRAATAVFASDELLQEYELQHQHLVASYEAAKRSQLDFRHLVDRSPDAVVIYDEAQVHYVNDAMMELFGVDERQELVGQPLTTICREPKSLLDSHDSSSRKSAPHQVAFVAKNGQTIRGEVKTMAAHFQDQPAFVSIIRDVTLRNEVLARAMEMDRIISMGMLAAGVAHEVNNPLAYVHANLQFLKECMEEGEFDTDDADAALRSSLQGMERIQAIVQDLNTFSRSPEEQLETVDLNAAIQPSLRWIEPKLRDRARLEVSLQDWVWVWSNANRIGQVVLNLLVNAADAIEPGEPEQNVVTVSTFLEEDRALVVVEDTGCGIPEVLQEKVFDPFVTTKPAGEGTGLGLFLTQQIVDRLRGQLTLESTVGEGTCVRLELPRYDLH